MQEGAGHVGGGIWGDTGWGANPAPPFLHRPLQSLLDAPLAMILMGAWVGGLLRIGSFPIWPPSPFPRKTPPSPLPVPPCKVVTIHGANLWGPGDPSARVGVSMGGGGKQSAVPSSSITPQGSQRGPCVLGGGRAKGAKIKLQQLQGGEGASGHPTHPGRRWRRTTWGPGVFTCTETPIKYLKNPRLFLPLFLGWGHQGALRGGGKRPLCLNLKLHFSGSVCK